MTRRSPGAGHIRQRKLKSGELRFDVLSKSNGKQVPVKLGLRSMEEAQAYLSAFHEERAKEGHFVPYDTSVMTLRRLGHLYLDALPPESLVTDRSRWRARVESATFIDWPVTQISESAVREWIADMATRVVASGKSAGKRPTRSTLQNSLNLLRGALRWAVVKRFVTQNVALTVTIKDSTIVRPRDSSQGEVFDYLRDHEVKRLMDAELPPAQRAAFVLLTFTGARPKDLYLLTWDRVDVRGGTILYYSYKRHRDYVAHLLPAAHEALRDWWMAHGQPSEGLLFPGPEREDNPDREHAKGYDWGWAPSTSRHGKEVPGYRVAAGIRRPVPLYSLRHTCACQLLLGSELFTGGRRWSLEEIASHLGHADLSTVKRYAIALGIASQRAVEESRAAIKAKRRGESG